MIHRNTTLNKLMLHHLAKYQALHMQVKSLQIYYYY